MIFSVVTVCLNPGLALDNTVKTVLEQDYNQYEYIIKDGGSNDGTESRKWKDPKIRFCSKKDDGIYDAMNQALELCKGKYILFLNAGDRFAHQSVLSLFADYCSRDDQAPVVYCDYYNEEQDFTTRYPDELNAKLLYRKTLCHQVTLIERNCFERYGRFDKEFTILADYDLLLRMLLKNRLKSHHVPIVGIRYLGGGVSSLPKTDRRKSIEYKRIHARYFKLSQRLIYGFIWRLTFPGIRIWMLRRIKYRSFKKAYGWLANQILSTRIEVGDSAAIGRKNMNDSNLNKH